MTETPVALVTGASRGIGRAIALDLAWRGYSVFGCSRNDADVPGIDHRAVDICDEHGLRGLIGEIAGTHGRLDALVNAAGAAVLTRLTARTRSTDAEHVLRTNVVGALIVCREAVRVMSARHSGRIVNLASTAVPLRTEGTAIYSASKSAVIQFSQVLAREIAPLGLTCNVVAPSLVETELTRELSPAVRERYLGSLTIKRMALLSDVTNAVWFFLRPESGYVTGQVLYLGLSS